jgi:hypothetical protein
MIPHRLKRDADATGAAAKALLDAAARKLLPADRTFDPDSPTSVLEWLSSNELALLEAALEGRWRDPPEDLWVSLQRRAIARALLNQDQPALDKQEIAGGMLAEVGGRYVTYLPDLAKPGRYRVDAAYLDGLTDPPPVELTTAQLAELGGRPWPPR